ncbi:MAG: hypothetical protein B6D38_00850 [Anaerolineae bacterium UTCFX1]|jgi:hypothetical protein|nr:MAG: hypothetical protein B6D38_00850 [Anaerolineae bacterium UTCFX1]
MNKTLSTILTVLVVLGLAGAIFFAGNMYARANSFGPSMMYGWSDNQAYGPNMMNGRGPSMMDGYGNNTYGPGGMMGNGGNMMNGYGYNNANVTPLTVDQTKAAAEKYLANLNNSDLEIAEIMVFDNNGYVIVKEASASIGAFELLVDPISQVAYPEHGPNMMWNLKYSGINHDNMMGSNGYGMMGNGGMMGYGNTMMQGWDNTSPVDLSSAMTVTPEQAIEYAQKYLDANISGAVAATDPMQFYGYYTLDFEKDGEVAGMLSINGYSGQVFLHTWHGAFIEEAEYE